MTSVYPTPYGLATHDTPHILASRQDHTPHTDAAKAPNKDRFWSVQDCCCVAQHSACCYYLCRFCRGTACLLVQSFSHASFCLLAASTDIIPNTSRHHTSYHWASPGIIPQPASPGIIPHTDTHSSMEKLVGKALKEKLEAQRKEQAAEKIQARQHQIKKKSPTKQPAGNAIGDVRPTRKASQKPTAKLSKAQNNYSPRCSGF